MSRVCCCSAAHQILAAWGLGLALHAWFTSNAELGSLSLSTGIYQTQSIGVALTACMGAHKLPLQSLSGCPSLLCRPDPYKILILLHCFPCACIHASLQNGCHTATALQCVVSASMWRAQNIMAYRDICSWQAQEFKKPCPV